MISADASAYLGRKPRELPPILAADEAELDAPSFGYDDAWAVGSAIREAAVREGYPVAISVVLGGQRAFHAATAGSAANNDAWLERKLRTVALFGRSTLAVRYEHLVRGEPFAATAHVDPLRYVDAGGGFPLRVRGTLVGGIGVSGLEMHEDHALVVAALRSHLAASEGTERS